RRHTRSYGDWSSDVCSSDLYITVGMLAFMLLLPLAATSTTGMIKRLGAARWRSLHRLVYVAAVAGCLHFIWLAKKVRVDPWVYRSEERRVGKGGGPRMPRGP